MNKKVILPLFSAVLSISASQALDSRPSSVSLVGAQAKDLYDALVNVEPTNGSKTASIAVIREYDGPGPFTYSATYSVDREIKTQSASGQSEAEALFEELYKDGKGLVIHGNPPIDTQDIIDAVATCTFVEGQEFLDRCVVQQN